MKILIVEAYTDGNIGSGALVENSVNLLCKNFPNAEIEILAQFPDHIEKFSGLPSYPELISIPFNQSIGKQVTWLLKTMPWMATHALVSMLRKKRLMTISAPLYTFDKRKLTALDRIEWADMVVSVGAERINDNFWKAIAFSLYMLWIIQLYNKYLVLFPQTIGPFHFRLTRFLSKKTLNGCDVIFLRDERSKDNIRKLGVKAPIVINTCDVAILQPEISTDEARRILKEYGILNNNQPLIGVSAMKWSYIKAKGESRYEEYKRAIARMTDKLIEEKNVRVIFLSTNTPVHGCREDDIEVARDIVSIMRNKGKAKILTQLFTPAQMKSIMRVLEMCLVTRMHACIFSTSAFTPTFSINYQFKLHEYMKLVGLGDYTIDIDKVTYERIWKIAEKTWKNRNEMRKILREKVSMWCENLELEMKKLPEYYIEKNVANI